MRIGKPSKQSLLTKEMYWRGGFQLVEVFHVYSGEVVKKFKSEYIGLPNQFSMKVLLSCHSNMSFESTQTH